MATKTPSESKEAKKLVAKIYKLRDRAIKIAAQAETLASDSAADRKVASQAKKIAAEAKKMIVDARPARKTADQETTEAASRS